MNVFIETDNESLFKHGEELCGDNVEIVRRDGTVTVVLADGLGSGVKANILSTLTSKIAATMLSSGANLVETVETVASTLPVCSERGVAYCTFTILRVHPDGRAHMVEYDNPEAVLMRDGREILPDKQAMTIDGKRILESSFVMEPDDMLIMFSDGAIHAGVGRSLNFGWERTQIRDYVCRCHRAGMPAKDMTKLLLGACNDLYENSPGDDTTVVTTRARLANPVTVMVGPPVNSEDDERVVRSLLDAPGQKVVCGGTTSSIVSRVSGRELNVCLDYLNPGVPPTAAMDGVDLVTEGVITLGIASEIMRQYCKRGTDLSDKVSLKQKDGATRLAKLLLQDATDVRFMVGRALNPAHQSPDMSIDLSIKLRLVKDIARTLRSMGKEVTLSYH